MIKEEWVNKGFVDEPVSKDINLKEEIDKLRKEKNAVIPCTTTSRVRYRI